MVYRYIHPACRRCSQLFAGPSGGKVVLSTGNQHLLHPVTSCQLQQQSAATQSIVMSPMLLLHLIADISRILDQVVISDPQRAASYRLTVCHHLKEICRQVLFLRLCRNGFEQPQMKLPAAKISALFARLQKGHFCSPPCQSNKKKLSLPHSHRSAARDGKLSAFRGATLIQALCFTKRSLLFFLNAETSEAIDSRSS